MTLFSSTAKCGQELSSRKIPSIYRKESSACGEAARAMHSVRPILNAALRAEGTIRVPSHSQFEARRTNAIAVAHDSAPIASSVHIVAAMAGYSTSAPKMHIAAAPANRNEPGNRSQAVYQGGCATSPRSNRRAAPKISAAAPRAGTARLIAHPAPTAPSAAPSRGWTPAIASAAGTANARRRRSVLALGKVSGPAARARVPAA